MTMRSVAKFIVAVAVILGCSNAIVLAATPLANKGKAVNVVQRPILWTQNRENLIREYAQLHYGKNMTKIIPRAVVVHWTAAENGDGVYNYFYGETMPDDGGGTLNVASHYLVYKDGTIYQLTPETAMNRHAIGYNWCAIGIENVGGSEGEENLTAAKASGLFIEHIPDYYADKIDPGPIFMNKLRNGLQGIGLKFFA